VSSNPLSRVRIVGSGLIGTSIGLALVQLGVSVEMVDVDKQAQALAGDLVNGTKVENPQLVIMAIPTSQLPLIIEGEFHLNPQSTFMDIGSIKNEVQLYVERFPELLPRFVPTHPMAGREIGGAGAARADLFQGRSWIVTPNQGILGESKNLVSEMIRSIGASIIEMPAAQHDAAVARVSHLPQIISSLLATQLIGSTEAALDLAGQGLRDTSRIAGSDEKLWSEIIFSNREEISTLLINLQSDLENLIESLDDPAEIEEFLKKGRQGKSLIPGKHGGKARAYSFLPIVIDDKPGQLAAIFNECAVMNVNVEDFGIEHSPGQLSALITLSLSDEDSIKLSEHLRSIGWNVHPIRKEK